MIPDPTSRTFRLHDVLSRAGFLSSEDRRVRYYARHLLNVVDEEEGQERLLSLNDIAEYLSPAVDKLTVTHTYRGATIYGRCIGEGCYWRGHSPDLEVYERRGGF
jgi:hypothetical protein